MSVSIAMFRIVNLESSTVLDPANLDIPIHDYNTRNRLDFITPFPRVDATRLNFCYNFLNIWNNLPANLKTIPRLGTFKKELIDYLSSFY